MVQLVVPVSSYPVDVNEVGEHLRLSSPLANEHQYLSTLIIAATEYVQNFTNRQLGTATYDLLLDAFPTGPIELPLPPLQSVESVSYIDPNGVEQAFTDFEVDAVNSKVSPAYGTYWPATRPVPNAVRVRFVCGYEELPYPIRAAILLLVADLYENREAQGPRLHENKTLERLLWPYRVF